MGTRFILIFYILVIYLFIYFIYLYIFCRSVVHLLMCVSPLSTSTSDSTRFIPETGSSRHSIHVVMYSVCPAAACLSVYLHELGFKLSACPPCPGQADCRLRQAPEIAKLFKGQAALSVAWSWVCLFYRQAPCGQNLSST